MKIRFKQAHTVKARNGASYKAGDVVEVNAASATHFVRRGLAEVVDDTAGVSNVETAAVEAPETAVRGRGRPRKLSKD
jgi:hypothetical protein